MDAEGLLRHAHAGRLHQASLSVGPAGTISGNAGGDRFNGRIRGSEQSDAITTIRMSGPPEARAREARYLKALEAAVKFEMTGGNLRQ